MDNPTDRIYLFAGSAVVLLLSLLLAIGRTGRTDWQAYQQSYFVQTGQPVDVRLRQLTPSLTGEPELCINCHMGLEEISPSHPVETFGCISCHGGNGATLDAEHAHATMRGGKNPSDLSVVEESCGPQCHTGFTDEDLNHVDRVLRSLQGTYAGGIAQVRYAFGAQPDPTPVYGVYGVQDDQVTTPHGLAALQPFPHESGIPIDGQFAQNCLESGCHLTAEPRQEPYFYRATGCAACHVIYENDGLYQGDDPTIPKDEPGHMRVHRFTTAIPYYQCNHCHNRGNFSLRRMEYILRPDIPPAGPPVAETMPPEGRRLIEYYQPIGQFTLCEWELDCIDCHTAQEAMGDGDIHPDQQEAQYIQCKTCHGALEELPRTVKVTEADQTALRQAFLNPNYDLQPGDEVLVSARGDRLGHVKVVDGQYILTSKITGETIPFNPVQGSACEQKVDQQESRYCHECHAYAR